MADCVSGNETAFNEVVEAYDKMRPAYVKALYQDLFAYRTITEQSKVLEIGIGTGKATRPILETGCELTAVELSDKMAKCSAQKFAHFPKFSVKNVAFQDFEAPDASYDLIYAATAFHWLPEKMGYSKVFRLLRPGGVFARFANHPYPKDEAHEVLYEEIQKLYAEYLSRNMPPEEYTEQDAKAVAGIGKAYGFVDIQYHLYQRVRTFTGPEYTSLLGTYSDHIVLPQNWREVFYRQIEAVVEQYGGVVTVHDTIDLQLYRKPG